MKIFIPLIVSCGLLVGQKNNIADTLIYRGFNKIVCINAPANPIAYYLTNGQTVSYTHLTLPTNREV